MTRNVTRGAIITDCTDPSARGRLLSRFVTLLGPMPTFVGFKAKTSNLQHGSEVAAMHVLDQVDAFRSPEIPGESAEEVEIAVIIVNSASRGNMPIPRLNGSPFCWWWEDDFTLVLSTLDGPVLPLAHHFGLIPGGVVQEMDVKTVMDWSVREGLVTPKEAARITITQFRSLEFQILVAKWLAEGRNVPSQETLIAARRTDGSITAWYVDSFGNYTLVARPEDIGYKEGRVIVLADGTEAVCIRHLQHVPDGTVALTVGSNGLRNPLTGEEVRLVELVIMRGSAVEALGFAPGDVVVTKQARAASNGQTASRNN